jgi:CBS domain-containing protein
MERNKLVTAPSATSVRRASEMMARKNIGALLVVDNEQLVGIFTERDALFRVIARRLDPEATLLSDVMTTAPKTIDVEKTYGHAMLLMHENGFRHVPVLERGKLIGMVLARNALDPALEEFVFEERRRAHIRETR